MRVLRFVGFLLFLAALGYVGDHVGLGELLGLTGVVSFAIVLGTGNAPPAGAIGNEIAAMTRRSYIPAVIVQVGQATPILAALLSNAQPASGGLSSISVDVQANAMVTPQATDYFGSFAQPTITPGVVPAEWNLCATVCPIGFLGFEGLYQLDAAIVPRIEVVMNDVGNQTATFLNTDLFTNTTYGTTHMDGLPLIRATTGLYGNINRSTGGNEYWKGNTLADPGGTPLPTRKLVAALINKATYANGGEMPNVGFCGLGTWTALQQDFIGVEVYQITPAASFDKVTQGARSGFTALMVNGVPIYADPTMAEGAFYFANTRYMSLYIHEAAAFAFTGFASMLPVRQIGYIGAMILIHQLVNVKPKSLTFQAGYSYIDMTV